MAAILTSIMTVANLQPACAMDAGRLYSVNAAAIQSAEGEGLVQLLSNTENEKELSAADIYRNASEAMVEIISTDKADSQYIGSGFFIGTGKVMTNFHVVRSAVKLEIRDYSGKSYKVKKILGYDEELDIILIAVESGDNAALKLCYDRPQTGDRVYTIGSPLGLTGTFSEGMVSCTDREMDNHMYYQVTLPTSTGSGGGPVLNSRGEVIGIITLTTPSGQNLNFAVPISEYKNAKKSVTWKKMSLKAFYKMNEPYVKESNDYRFSDSFFQLCAGAGWDEDEPELSPSEIRSNAESSIVTIKARDDKGNVSLGTGFFISETQLATAYHVVQNAAMNEFIEVTDYYENVYRVEAVKGDEKSDAAVLTVKGTKQHGILQPEYDYLPQTGESVYTYGNPLYYDNTFAEGIVSTSMRVVEGFEYIQTTAPVSSGSSGGVLINKKGNAIGIVVFTLPKGQNLNFMLSVKYLQYCL